MTPETSWPEYTPDEWAELGRAVEDVHQRILGIRRDVQALIDEARALIAMGYVAESLGYGTLLKWQDVAESYTVFYPQGHQTLTQTHAADEEGRVIQLFELFLSDRAYIEDIPLACFRGWHDGIQPRLASTERKARDVLDRCWHRRDVALEAMRAWRRQMPRWM